MVQIPIKYADKALVPRMVFSGGYAEEYMTADGIECSIQFISTWNNSDGSYNEELDGYCKNEWGCPLDAVKSLWISRGVKIDGIWHLIKLTKI